MNRLFKIAIAGAVLASLGACTTEQAAVKAFDSEATSVVQNEHDDQLGVEVQALCATSYAAILRNAGKIPGLVGAITSLCGNAATQSGKVLIPAPAGAP